mmetsp:Transcript_9067/g.12864  ORF Transcript_9067/g.12864 Transcript_9067/m.12864 type:complete len:165 (-) Transcript_9067:176-670(-)
MMNGYSRNFMTVTLLFFMSNTCSAFLTQPAKASASALHLLPSQGKQLEAAWNAATLSKENAGGDSIESREDSQEKDEITPVSAARSFVSRIFELPSHLHLERKNDIVYYPVVGFRWVPCDKDGYRVLPTSSVASCRVPNLTKEETVGWFSPASKPRPDGSGFEP